MELSLVILKVLYFLAWISPSLPILSQSVELDRRQEMGEPVGPTVTLDYGSFTGIQNTSTGITYFRGIRFSDPPIGKLRWRAPVSPPSTHLGAVDATQYANACVQTKQRNVTAGYSEDCLFGNVYIPINTRTDARLPVLVWFHGGGYQAGSTHDAPPDLILNSTTKPLIFISFAYRLGQFGFLGGSQVKADGALNVGLLDQRAALRWVQRYIGIFGGDNTKVTIWGQSAGAGSVMFHLIANSGKNEDLFHAAIADSPPLTFMPAFNDSYIEEIYEQFAELVGCKTPALSLQCLRTATPTSLIAAGSLLVSSHQSTLYIFAPLLDTDFIRMRPVEAFRSSSFAQVPVLFGSNTNEGSHWSSTIPDPSANTSMPNATEATVFYFFQGQYASIQPEDINEAVNPNKLDLYPLGQYNESFSLQAQQMYGEARYICTAEMMAGAMQETGIKEVYQYHYNNPHLGSNHHDELYGFFSPPENSDSDDLILFENMRKYWTSFVTSGHPTSKNGLSWTPVLDGSGGPRILLQPGNETMEEESSALSTRCEYWHSISKQMQT